MNGCHPRSQGVRTSPHPDAKLGDLAAEAGLARVEIVAWRDLDHPEAGGSELHAARIAERWAQAGIDVTIKASRAPGMAPGANREGVRIVRPAGRYGIFPTVMTNGLTRQRRRRPDGVVEIWNGLPFLSPLWAGCARTVFLHHVHDGMWGLTLPPPVAAIGRFVELTVAPRFYRRAQIVTLSESSRRTIVEMMGLDPAQVRVVEPGVDDLYAPGGVRAHHPYFVAVGRLMPYKRTSLLIDGLVAAQARHPSLRAVIVGEGRDRAALQARIDGHGAAGWLQMAGRLDDAALLATYQRAWAVLSASAFEGWGMTITEAAACGTPAIASDIAGHVDAVRDGMSGLLFSNRSQLEAALCAMIERPALRARLGQGALRRSASLTWDRTAFGTLSSLVADAQRRKASVSAMG